MLTSQREVEEAIDTTNTPQTTEIHRVALQEVSVTLLSETLVEFDHSLQVQRLSEKSLLSIKVANSIFAFRSSIPFVNVCIRIAC